MLKNNLEPWEHFLLKDGSIHYMPKEKAHEFIVTHIGQFPHFRVPTRRPRRISQQIMFIDKPKGLTLIEK